MKEKKLQRRSRRELVEMLYKARQNEQALREENEALREQLADKQMRIARAGSLAEVSAVLNGLFEAAQATADDYLANIKSRQEESPFPQKEQRDEES